MRGTHHYPAIPERHYQGIQASLLDKDYKKISYLGMTRETF
jgi:hypothetical protein